MSSPQSRTPSTATASAASIARHQATTIDQFTRQAIPFANMPAHLDAMATLIEMSGAGPHDTVLDVACGPGLVACEFASRTHHVTGIDLTAAMIEQARGRAAGRNQTNVSWDIGDVTTLPYRDGAFTRVITRYSFHHFASPHAVFAEMCRVCAPGGRVLVADVALPASKVDVYNELERWRDPSHTAALTHDAFAELFAASGLTELRRADYDVDMEVEALLASSFPNPGDAERFRQAVIADIGHDRLGARARRDATGKVHFTFPISVYVGTRPA